jgi:hypothetical protein
MRRLVALLGLSLLCGCNPSGGAPGQAASNTGAGNNAASSNDEALDSSSPASSVPVSAFRLDETKQIVFLETRSVPPQRRRFDIGQGSITLETIRVKDGTLTFRYTPEVEGGYTIYECTVPVSSTPLEIKIARGGTPGATSFDLAKCRVIRRGSLLSP